MVKFDSRLFHFNAHNLISSCHSDLNCLCKVLFSALLENGASLGMAFRATNRQRDWWASAQINHLQNPTHPDTEQVSVHSTNHLPFCTEVALSGLFFPCPIRFRLFPFPRSHAASHGSYWIHVLDDSTPLELQMDSSSHWFTSVPNGHSRPTRNCCLRSLQLT